MANLYFYEDSSCTKQLSHSAVSITGTTLTAAALISYPGTAPAGQELDYWMISGKLAGLSDIKAETGLNVTGYIVSNSLMLYPVWKAVISFTPSTISAIPMGNVVAPQGATIRKGKSYTYNNTTKKWELSNFTSQNNYDIVITDQDTNESLPANQITFITTDTTFDADNVQLLGSQLIDAVKTLQVSDTDRVAKSGDTMTGNLNITGANTTVKNGKMIISNSSNGKVEIDSTSASIKMTDHRNQAHYIATYTEDTTTNDYALTYVNDIGGNVYIIGVADPIKDTGVANRRYVLNAIGAATADIKTYIDAAIEEKIADAIGGTY